MSNLKTIYLITNTYKEKESQIIHTIISITFSRLHFKENIKY